MSAVIVVHNSGEEVVICGWIFDFKFYHCPLPDSSFGRHILIRALLQSRDSALFFMKRFALHQALEPPSSSNLEHPREGRAVKFRRRRSRRAQATPKLLENATSFDIHEVARTPHGLPCPGRNEAIVPHHKPEGSRLRQLRRRHRSHA